MRSGNRLSIIELFVLICVNRYHLSAWNWYNYRIGRHLIMWKKHLSYQLIVRLIVSWNLSLQIQGFNIYINGSFHCCLRYKQLHSLHEQLKRSLMNLSLPQFPPKKLLTLTHSELEQRRLALERYMQLSKLSPSLKLCLVRFLSNFLFQSDKIQSCRSQICCEHSC